MCEEENGNGRDSATNETSEAGKELPITFRERKCYVLTEQYGAGGTALKLLEANGTPALTASTWIEDLSKRPDLVYIKNWSENAGVLEALVRFGIVEKTGQFASSGYVKPELCKLTSKALEAFGFEGEEKELGAEEDLVEDSGEIGEEEVFASPGDKQEIDPAGTPPPEIAPSSDIDNPDVGDPGLWQGDEAVHADE